MENKDKAVDAIEIKSELKATRFEVEQQLNQFVGNLKVEGMGAKAKLSLVKLKIQLAKIIEDINDFRKKTVESINKPADYDKLKEESEKEGAAAELKAKFKAMEEEYNGKFGEVALPFFNEVVSIPFDFITEDDFYSMVEHNDINVIFGYEYIFNKLVQK